jgi:hypothetical protein
LSDSGLSAHHSGAVPERPELTVTRLLQNPLGQPAPPGEPGDLVCVSDGRSKIYLLPSEYAAATEVDLRRLLARQPLKSAVDDVHRHVP